MPRYETHAVSICTTCAMAAASGVLPADDRPVLDTVDVGFHVIVGDGDTYFSHYSCDTCSSSLSGDRHDATMMSIYPIGDGDG